MILFKDIEGIKRKATESAIFLQRITSHARTLSWKYKSQIDQTLSLKVIIDDKEGGWWGGVVLWIILIRRLSEHETLFTFFLNNDNDNDDDEVNSMTSEAHRATKNE